MEEKELQNFNDYALKKVYFYIESKFWSKLDINILSDWLNNFKTDEEKYCAFKLLDRFVYYSEDDIIRLLEFGFNEKILNREILKDEIRNSFRLNNNTLINKKTCFKDEILILPLITDNISESSLAMARYLTNDLGFPENKILDLNKLNSAELKTAKKLIIIDDFIGTSSQIFKFWNDTKIVIDGKKVITNTLKNNFDNLEIEYFCLVCTEEGLENFMIENNALGSSGLKITYCEMLSKKFKVFGEKSVYFKKKDIEYFKNILENLCLKNNINLLGYKSLDYAVAFHHSIPDSSLPLFHKNRPDWKPLFKNKKSNN